MKYFMLKHDKDYTDTLNIVNWFGKVDTDSMRQGKYEKLKKKYSLQLRENKNIDYIDMIIEPFLAVSAMMKRCMERYESNIEYSEVYLLEKSSGKEKEYFIPYLTEEDCLAETSVINTNKTVVEKAVIDLSKMDPEKYLFLIGGLNAKYVVARIELAESILRRGARGIQFIPVETVNA